MFSGTGHSPSLPQAQPGGEADPGHRCATSRGCRWPRGFRLPAQMASLSRTAPGFFWMVGGSGFVFFLMSYISTFSPPIHSHSRGECGLQAFCFLHVPTVQQWESVCPFFQLKKKINSPNMQTLRNPWQLKKQMCLMKKLPQQRGVTSAPASTGA